jgi:hypothetical protein
VTIPGVIDGRPVTRLGDHAFAEASLSSVTIPGSVTQIESGAFAGYSGLMAVYFQGNAPSLCASVLESDDRALVYYLAGTTG